MKTRILLVDDSALVRQTLQKELSKHEDFEIVGSAPDPYFARDIILKQDVDIVILDIEMPRMDGLTFLDKLMKFKPTKVIILSSLAKEGSEVALEALKRGALECLCKPGSMYSLGDLIVQLPDKIRQLKSVDLSKYLKSLSARFDAEGFKDLANLSLTNKLVVIGASTGGVQALESIISNLPANFSPVVITQHMPPGFTASFAKRLNQLSKLEVKEAEDGDTLSPGKVLVAPGNIHLLITRRGANFVCELKNGPLVNGHRPSVNVTFKSAAKVAGVNTIGVLLTGMGSDGAEGLLEIKNSGGYTIVESEETAAVFGMPKAAIQLGAHCEILALSEIPKRLVEVISQQRPQPSPATGAQARG